ncbi:MAG: alpha/beta hydrolase [bacterium]
MSDPIAQKASPAKSAGSPVVSLQHSDGSSIRCVYHAGASPTVVFCGGFNSDMTGTKALAFEQACVEAGRAYLRFDYRGHGISTGNLEDHTIKDWLADARLVIDQQLQPGEPLVLVGSSMGMWVVCLLIAKYRERIAGCVGIAGAPDFTSELFEERLNEGQRQALQRGETVNIPNEYDDEGYNIRRQLFEEGQKHRVLNKPIAVPFPVRLFQGSADDAVPWQHSIRLLETLEGEDIQLTLIKDGDHRLSEPAQLVQIAEAILAF